MTRILVALSLLTQLAFADRHSDWIKDGEFKGKRILIACWYWEGQGVGGAPMNHVPQVLRQMGFTVDVLREPKHLPDLGQYDQAWIVSGTGSSFDKSDVQKLRAFLQRGKGVYVLADNTPYTYEANVIGAELYQTHLQGDYYGGKVVHVVAPGKVKQMVDEAMKKGDMEKLAGLRRAGYLDGKLYAEDHELLSGIEQIYEGITVAAQTPAKDLEVILRDSANENLVSVSTRKGELLVLDGAFTRLYCGWEENTATSTNWYRNVAAYLAGKRRADLPKEQS
jgi:hypothetical protein